jgi:hypothetical protein
MEVFGQGARQSVDSTAELAQIPASVGRGAGRRRKLRDRSASPAGNMLPSRFHRHIVTWSHRLFACLMESESAGISAAESPDCLALHRHAIGTTDFPP